MTEDKLKEIEARANAATPGPWEENRRYITMNGTNGDVRRLTYSAVGPDTSTDVQAMTDSVLIAHAREDIPALIAEVRRLTTGAEIQVHCPHCKQLSLTVVTGGRLIKNEPEGEPG